MSDTADMFHRRCKGQSCLGIFKAEMHSTLRLSVVGNLDELQAQTTPAGIHVFRLIHCRVKQFSLSLSYYPRTMIDLGIS